MSITNFGMSRTEIIKIFKNIRYIRRALLDPTSGPSNTASFHAQASAQSGNFSESSEAIHTHKVSLLSDCYGF